MREKYLPVSESVYDAVIELNRRLQEAYEDVTISDTLDYMGHHLFIYQQMIDLIRSELNQMKSQSQSDMGIMGGILDLVQSLAKNRDATCFIRSDIDIPFHWFHTRWLLDIQGKNVFKCILEPDEMDVRKARGEYKIHVE